MGPGPRAALTSFVCPGLFSACPSGAAVSWERMGTRWNASLPEGVPGAVPISEVHSPQSRVQSAKRLQRAERNGEWGRYGQGPYQGRTRRTTNPRSNSDKSGFW